MANLPADCPDCGATNDVDADALSAGQAVCEFCGAKLSPPSFDVQLEACEVWLLPGVMAKVQALTGLGIVDAKKLVENAPTWLTRGVSAEAARKAEAEIALVGGKTTISPARPHDS